LPRFFFLKAFVTQTKMQVCHDAEGLLGVQRALATKISEKI
jgi:hypothetical protein